MSEERRCVLLVGVHMLWIEVICLPTSHIVNFEKTHATGEVAGLAAVHVSCPLCFGWPGAPLSPEGFGDLFGGFL